MNYSICVYSPTSDRETVTLAYMPGAWRRLLGLSTRIEHYSRDLKPGSACWHDENGRPASVDAMHAIRRELLRLRS